MKTKLLKPLAILILTAGFLLPSISGFSQLIQASAAEVQKEMYATKEYNMLQADFARQKRLSQKVEKDLVRLVTSSSSEQRKQWDGYLNKLLEAGHISKKSPLLKLRDIELRDDPESIQRARAQLAQIKAELRKIKRTPVESAIMVSGEPSENPREPEGVSNGSVEESAAGSEDKDKEEGEDDDEESDEDEVDEETLALWEEFGGAIGTLIGWIVGAADDDDDIEPEDAAEEGNKIGKAIGRFLGSLFGKKKKKKKKKK